MNLNSLNKFVHLQQALTAEKQKLETRLAAINRALSGQTATKVSKRAKRKISAAGRARISTAQKARWAKLKAGRK